MKPMWPAAILLVACSVISTAWAQHFTLPDAPCRKISSPAERTQCFIAQSKTADASLEKQLARIQRVLSLKEWVALGRTQYIWKDYRESNCRAEQNLYEGRAAGVLAYYSCLEGVTRERLGDLLAIYKSRLAR